MTGDILGVSAVMFSSVATGLTLIVLTIAAFWLMLARRDKNSMRIHKVLTWVLVAGFALHGLWGVVGVFVLKS